MLLFKGNELDGKGTHTLLISKVLIKALEIGFTRAHQGLVYLSFLGPQRTTHPSLLTCSWGSSLVLAIVTVVDAVHVTFETKHRTCRHEISMLCSSPHLEMSEAPEESHLQY